MFAGRHLVSVGIVALLIAVVAPAFLAPLSPMSFALMGPAHFAFGRRAERRTAFLREQAAAGV